MKNNLPHKGLLFTILLAGLFIERVNGQALLIENFDYVPGTNLTSNGWNAHSAEGTNPVKVYSIGLSYIGYFSSDIGLSAMLNNTGEDVNKSFTPVTSGVIYFSFLVNVNAITNEYFFHLGKSSTTYRGKVFTNGTGNNYNFGLSLGSNTPALTTVEQYTTGSVYLLVLKYSFVPGLQNDQVCLFVFSGTIPGEEPATPTIGPLVEAGVEDVNNIGSVALRQYSTSQNIIIDGIRVATNWTDIIPVLTGINDLADTDIRVYPVPAKSEICVMNIQSFKKIEILNVTGAVIITTSNLDNPEVRINVDNLKSGLYFLRLTGESGNVTKRFIKD